MAETPLAEAVRILASGHNVQLSDAAQKALLLAKSLRSAAPKEYSLPSSYSLDGFRGVQPDWAFDQAALTQNKLNLISK